MLRVLLLGTGAGGGIPQWNSAGQACLNARATKGKALRSQCSVAVSADGESWYLLNASPDLRQQIIDNKALHPDPKKGVRNSPIEGVLLANGEIDGVTGLFCLRENMKWTLSAPEPILDHLAKNPIFDALDRKVVTREILTPLKEVALKKRDDTDSGLFVTTLAIKGKVPLYAEKGKESGQTDNASYSADDEADNYAFYIRDAQGRACLFIPGCAEIDETIIGWAEKSDLLLFDGTLWQDDEMIRSGLSGKTGARMGHVSMNEPNGPIARFKALTRPKKFFIHVNNSNPVLIEGSPEHSEMLKSGWDTGYDGQEFHLGL